MREEPWVGRRVLIHNPAYGEVGDYGLPAGAYIEGIVIAEADDMVKVAWDDLYLHGWFPKKSCRPFREDA